MLEVWVVQNQVLWKGLKGIKREDRNSGLRYTSLVSESRAQVPSPDGILPPHHRPPRDVGVPAPLKLGQSLRPTSHCSPRLLIEGVSSPVRGRRGACTAALTDLSAAPGVLRTAVQDVRELIRVEAGGGPLPAQVLVHGDGHRRQRRPRGQRRRCQQFQLRPGPKSRPRTARVPAPGPPLPLHRRPSARDRPQPRKRRCRRGPPGGLVLSSRPREP